MGIFLNLILRKEVNQNYKIGKTENSKRFQGIWRKYPVTWKVGKIHLKTLRYYIYIRNNGHNFERKIENMYRIFWDDFMDA